MLHFFSHAVAVLGFSFGTLLPTSARGSDIAYEFVVDLSGSMNRYYQGISLKAHAISGLQAVLPTVQPFALRVFGHRAGLEDKRRSCLDSELVLPLGNHSGADIQSKLVRLQAVGFTPLANTLRAVEQDLGSAKGKRVVVVISDGVDSCDGDPIAEIERLRARGLDIVVNPIGLGLDAAARRQLALIALVSGGKFAEIHSPADLPGALSGAISYSGGEAKPRPLPGDLGRDEDAGDGAENSLNLRKNEWFEAQLGARSGSLSDATDYFKLQVTGGEKFILQTESLRGAKVEAAVLSSTGDELALIAAGFSESEPFTSPAESKEFYIRFRSVGDALAKYRFKIVPLVEIQ